MTVTTDLTNVSSPATSDEVLAVVRGFCAQQNITPDLLALVLELNSEVYTPFINGYFSNDGRTMEMFMRLFWIVGINEADPSRFGVHSAEVNQWAVEHIEMVAGKRRELLRVAVEVKTENARRAKEARVAHARKEYLEARNLSLIFWGLTLTMGLLWLFFHFGVFIAVGAFGGVFAAVTGLITLVAYSEVTDAEHL